MARKPATQPRDATKPRNPAKKPHSKKPAGEKRPVGHPPTPDKWTPEFVAEMVARLESYTEKTAYPSLAEFCYQNRIHRKRLYEHPELDAARDRLLAKKEVYLEKAGLKLTKDQGSRGTFIIFALKQLGWTDKHELEHSGEIGVKIVDDIQ